MNESCQPALKKTQHVTKKAERNKSAITRTGQLAEDGDLIRKMCDSMPGVFTFRAVPRRPSFTLADWEAAQ